MRSTYNTHSPVRVGALNGTATSPPPSFHRTPTAADRLNASTSRSLYGSTTRGAPSALRTTTGMGFNTTNGGSFTTTSTARQTANRFPEHPTSEAKLRMVFEELDLNSTGKVDVEGFRRVFAALHLNLSQPTVDDLFSRADINRNGWLTFSEYLNWAHHYPALIDALYFRSRELIQKSRKEAALDATTAPLEELSRKERAAQAHHEATAAAVEEKEHAIKVADQIHRDRLDEESLASRALVEAEKESELARAARGAADADLIIGKEKEKTALLPLNESRKHIAITEERLAATEQGLADLKQKEKDLLDVLADVRRDIQKTQDAASETESDLVAARETETTLEKAYTAAVAEVHALQTAVEAAEEAITARSYDQSKAETAHQHAAQELKNAYAVKNAEERQLPPLHEQESAAKQNHENSTRTLEAAGVEIKRLSNELDQYLNERAEQELAELPLIEGEIRLREQRFNLDDRDGVHSGELNKFATSVNRTRA